MHTNTHSWIESKIMTFFVLTAVISQHAGGVEKNDSSPNGSHFVLHLPRSFFSPSRDAEMLSKGVNAELEQQTEEQRVKEPCHGTKIMSSQ